MLNFNALTIDETEFSIYSKRVIRCIIMKFPKNKNSCLMLNTIA
jgi:hypothetical protein